MLTTQTFYSPIFHVVIMAKTFAQQTHIGLPRAFTVVAVAQMQQKIYTSVWPAYERDSLLHQCLS